MEVGDANSGLALARVLGVLVNRLLARAERAGARVRAVVLSAQLLPGGGWRERVVFRQALCDAGAHPARAVGAAARCCPLPPAMLRLSVEGFGPPPAEQGVLLERRRTARRQPDGRRAARCARRSRRRARWRGQQAALRAVCVDPDSRVPERRVVLAPIPE